jgi:hypothetical protein
MGENGARQSGVGRITERRGWWGTWGLECPRVRCRLGALLWPDVLTRDHNRKAAELKGHDFFDGQYLRHSIASDHDWAGSVVREGVDCGGGDSYNAVFQGPLGVGSKGCASTTFSGNKTAYVSSTCGYA